MVNLKRTSLLALYALPAVGVLLVVFVLSASHLPWLYSLLFFTGLILTVLPLLYRIARLQKTHTVNALDILNYGPDPIVVANTQGDIVASNPAADRMFQTGDEGLVGRSIEDLLPDSFRSQHRELRQLFFSSNGRMSMRNSVSARALNGNELEIEVHLNYTEYLGEVYAIAALRDISDFKNAERQVKASEKSFREIFEQSAIGLAHVSLGGRFIRVNQHLCELMGYTQEEMLSLTSHELTHPNDREATTDMMRRALSGEAKTASVSRRYRHKNGRYIWTQLTKTLVKDELGQPDYFISSIQDISDLKHAEELLQQSERKFKTIVESISDEMMVWMATPDFAELLYVNEGYEKIWGRTRQSLYNAPKSFLELIHEEDRDRVQQVIAENQMSHWSIDYRIVRDDGGTRYIHDVGHGVFENDELQYLISSAVDRTNIMERQNMLDDSLFRLKEAYKSLEVVSRTDALTGVLNRSALFETVNRAFDRYTRYQTPATLVFIDLDRFKEVNDSFGHVAGDQTLVAVVNRLKQIVRSTDDIGRYGGDEFIVLLGNSDESQARDFCHRVGPALSVKLENDQFIEAGLSFGISQLGREVKNVEQWIALADSQMYDDKSQVQ